MNNIAKININCKHKDRLSNYIFGNEQNKERKFALYDTINVSYYTDSNLIEFNNFENVLYMSMKNDVSFLITDIMIIFEH